jgi:hypothetical protein
MDVYLDKFMVDEGLENAAAGFHDLLGLLMHIQIPSDNLPTFTALEKSFEQSLCVFLPVDDGPRIRVFITVADPLSRITVLCNKYLYASKHHLLPTDFQQTLLFKDPKNIPDDVEVYYNIQYKWMNEDIPDYITLIDYGMRTPHSEPALYLRLVQDTPPEMGENGVVVKPGLRVIDLSDTVIYGFTGLFKIPNCSHVVSPLTRRIINLFSPLQPKKYRLFHDVIQKLSNEMILRLTQPGESLSCFSPSVEFIYLYPHWFNITVRHIAYRLRNSHYLQRYHLYLRMIRRPPLFPRRHLQKQTLHISKENILEEGISILEDREGFCFKKLKLELVDAWGNTSKCATYEFWDMFVRELGDELFSGRSELLFPKPVVNPKYMRVLGMLVARVILISNPIDLPLNPAFFTLIRGLTYPTLKDVDPSLWKDYASNNPMPTHFFYPLFDEFPLEPDREMRELKTRDDWVEYWRLVESWTCGEIFRNTYSQHFIEGFNSVCSFTGPMRQNHGLGLDELLRIFTDKEIYKLITGYDDFFATARLPEEIIPQKGYDHNSYPYIFLGSLIQTGPVEDHKKILKFITGRSAPPRGGLSFLNPLITIVPSVENTDSTPLEVVKGENVLILPMYSSQGVLARQWKAVRE